jgi:hypothetical protein
MRNLKKNTDFVERSRQMLRTAPREIDDLGCTIRGRRDMPGKMHTAKSTTRKLLQNLEIINDHSLHTVEWIVR